ncbi:hypothetical protein V8E54_005091 [Elaphomyces granulatus]
MCFGSSKAQSSNAEPPPVPLRNLQSQGGRLHSRPGTQSGARGKKPGTREGNREATSAGIRGSSRQDSRLGTRSSAHGPRKGSSGGRKTSDRQGLQSRRQGSRAESRRSSAIPSSSHGKWGHEAQLSALEEIPEDSTIHHDIMTLNTFIDLHAEGYYISHSEGESLIRQRIGETILNDIMKNNMNENSVSTKISQYLAPYIENQEDQERENHLLELCKLAKSIRRMTERHPSEWVFSWNSKSGFHTQVQ